MKPSDFFVRGRQFFGFLVPGIMWVAFLCIVINKSLMEFIENGNPIIRGFISLGISYIVGFILQTLIFPVTADVLKGNTKLPLISKIKLEIKVIEDNKELIKSVLRTEMPEHYVTLKIDDDQIPEICRNYVIEKSVELKKLIFEFEDDINFIVANFLPGPLLAIAYFYRNSYPQYFIYFVIGCTLIYWILLTIRLKHYLRREKSKWAEYFLMMQFSRWRPEQKIEKEQEVS